MSRKAASTTSLFGNLGGGGAGSGSSRNRSAPRLGAANDNRTRKTGYTNFQNFLSSSGRKSRKDLNEEEGETKVFTFSKVGRSIFCIGGEIIELKKVIRPPPRIFKSEPRKQNREESPPRLIRAPLRKRVLLFEIPKPEPPPQITLKFIKEKIVIPGAQLEEENLISADPNKAKWKPKRVEDPNNPDGYIPYNPREMSKRKRKKTRIEKRQIMDDAGNLRDEYTVTRPPGIYVQFTVRTTPDQLIIECFKDAIITNKWLQESESEDDEPFAEFDFTAKKKKRKPTKKFVEVEETVIIRKK